MSFRLFPMLAGVALSATAGSAFAFDAGLENPMPLRTEPSRLAAVITVIPANTVVDLIRCNRGWCETTYAGRVGFVHSPILTSTRPGPAFFAQAQAPAAPTSPVGSLFGAATPATPGNQPAVGPNCPK
jgi:hypothetical protein